MDNDEAPLRNVIILKKLPFLALSGDLLGDLKIWNLDSGKNYLFTLFAYVPLLNKPYVNLVTLRGQNHP